MAGWPYFLLCVIFLPYLSKIDNFILAGRYSALRLWVVSIAILLCFGAIQGGFREGVTGIASSENHNYDAALIDYDLESIRLHNARVRNKASPPYRAAHSRTHPPFTLLYWKFLTETTSPFLFSLINAFLFSLSFPVLYWALAKESDRAAALSIVLLTLLTPGLLVYGVGSDDAVVYFLWAAILALSRVGLRERRIVLTAGAAALLVVASNLSYSSLVMTLGMFAFTFWGRMGDLPAHLWRIRVPILICAAIIGGGFYLEWRTFGFSIPEGMRTVFTVFQAQSLRGILEQGQYVRAINNRLMTVLDFMFFAGPAFIYFFVYLLRRARIRIMQWKVANAAFAVLTVYIAIMMPGAGESARGWGGLYLVFGFACLPFLASCLGHREIDSLRVIVFGWAVGIQLWRIRVPILICAAIIGGGFYLEWRTFGFSIPEGMRTVFTVFQAQSLRGILEQGQYVRAINNRLMTVLDFMFFAGPAFIYFFVYLLRRARIRIMQWKVANAAFAVLTVYIAIMMPGAGESARGWGGLYLVFGFACLPFLASCLGHREIDSLRVIVFGWAVSTQLLLTFIW